MFPVKSTSPAILKFPCKEEFPITEKLPVNSTFPCKSKSPRTPMLPFMSTLPATFTSPVETKPFVDKTPSVNVTFEEIFGDLQRASLSLTKTKLPVAGPINTSIFSAHELVLSPQ